MSVNYLYIFLKDLVLGRCMHVRVWGGRGWGVCAYEFKFPGKPEEGIESPGDGVAGGCELPITSPG